MKENKKLKVTMTLDEDDMVVLRGGAVGPGTGSGSGTGTIKCTVSPCASCGDCDAISTRGWHGATILTGF